MRKIRSGSQTIAWPEAARLTGNKARIARYRGSRDGALAYARGESALAAEGRA